MRRTRQYLLVLLIVSSSLYVIPGGVLPVHSALTGKVCIARVGSTSCPTAPILINATKTVPQQVSVAVAINSSQTLNTFDITLLTNSSVLKPADAVATGSVINGTSSSLTILTKCIGGTGTGCSSTDTKDTLHYAISSTTTTTGTTTGLLFTATYNVSAYPSISPIGFQTGCGKTSVGGGVCITISAGAAGQNPETAQGARFTNRDYFDLQTAFSTASLTVPEGSTNNSLFLNVTSINGFSATVTIASFVSPSGPTMSVAPSSAKVNGSNPFFPGVTVTVAKFVTPGTYNMTFTGTSPGYPANTLTVPLIVPPPDFTIAASPNTVQFNVSRSGSATITLASQGNFAGIVNLTLSGSPGLQAALQLTRLNIKAAGSNSTTLTVSASLGGFYTLNVTGTGIGSQGRITRATTIAIRILDFTMYVGTGPVVLTQGTNVTEFVNFDSAQHIPYNVTVTITKIFIAEVTSVGLLGPSAGISVICNPTKLNLTNSGTTSEIITFSKCVVVGNREGNYTVAVLAVSGSVSHATTFPVQVLGPDFSMIPQAPVQTLDVGSSASFNITLAQLQQLNSTITLSALFPTQLNPASPPNVSINVQQVMINSTSPSATATVTVTASASAPTGIYTLQLTGFSKTPGINHVAIVTIVVTTTKSPHNLVIDSVSANPTMTTVGSSVTVTVRIENLGSVTENSTLVGLAGDLSIANQNITIRPGQNMTLTLTWNTAGFAPGTYIMGAKILGLNLTRSSIPETLTAANTNFLQSPYFEPAIIAALIVIVAIVAVLLLQTRRKTKPT